MKYIIVGYGNIGHKRHGVLGNKCIATLDPNPTTGADYQNTDQIPGKILKQCDAVNIVVPNKGKADIVEYWLSKGKNVLVEKPLFLTKTQANKLTKAAKKNNVIWYTSYNYRFEPHIERINKLIKEGFLGKLYKARLVYGFGNVKQLIGTWRESANGALDEIGCHLIDMVQQFFGYKSNKFEAISLQKNEARAYDHCLFSTTDKKVLMEVSWITWKNVFQIEIYGEKGSLHMDGLCKWGKSELIVRKRVFPAGAPEEEVFVESGPPDPTWEKDIKYFERMVKEGKTSIETDLMVNKAFDAIIKS